MVISLNLHVDTIKIPSWTPSLQRKKDKSLLDVIQIMEQLRIMKSKDLRQDLPSLVDIQHHYKWIMYYV